MGQIGVGHSRTAMPSWLAYALNLFREQYEGIRTFKAGLLRSPSTSHSLVVGGSDEAIWKRFEKKKIYIYIGKK
jgi:hypothetical protein